MREERKEVLVVGAGPAGLWTALALAKAGVEVKIIDQEDRTTARSYACALHPRTLELLDRMGIAERLIRAGRKLDRIVFYEGETRHTEVKLTQFGGRFPFLLVLPQNVLESALEEELGRVGVPVHWKHRLDSFSPQVESLSVIVEALGGTGLGYVVPHWETTVRSQIPLRVQFLVGADGHHSLTRRRMELDFTQHAGAEVFAAYEFESDLAADDEVRVVLAEDSTNVLWPLPGGKFRWTFQIAPSDSVNFPDKERRAVRFTSDALDEQVRDYVTRVAGKRAPWFKAKVKEVTWCSRVAFEQRLAARFGHGRCWLVGDAAHQTGPVGVQSMNSAFLEGEELAGILKKIVHEEGDMELLESYNERQTSLWRGLIGQASLKAGEGASPWVIKRSHRLLSCLPGIGPDLGSLAAQIGLRL